MNLVATLFSFLISNPCKPKFLPPPMSALHLSFFFIVFSTVLAASADNREYIKSLSFLTDLRSCSLNNKYRGIKLPQLASYTKTGNSTVNTVVENEYIMFWQKLQERSFVTDTKYNYAIDTNYLLRQSKGAALAKFEMAAYDPDTYNYSEEKKVLRPLTRTSKAAFSKCLNMSEGSVLDCIYNVVEDCKAYGELDREMMLCAIRILSGSVFIAMASAHKFSQSDLDLLRTDDCALSFVGKWDRNSSLFKILYLNYFLNARKIIAHLAKMTEESKRITTMQANLESLVQAEFPHKLMTEMRRIKISGTIIVGNAKKNQKYVVKELYLWFVKQPGVTIEKNIVLYLEESILHLSVEESTGTKYGDNLNILLRHLHSDIYNGKVNLEENPANLETDWC